MLSPKIAKILRFLFSGGTAAAVNIFVLFALVEYFRVYYLAASVLSYLAALTFGFSLQKFLTFKDRALHRVHTQLLGYVAVSVTNLGINTVLMYFFVSMLGIWYILAQMLSAALIAFESYLAYQKFVFAGAPEEQV